ncbi:hypothetical protein [Azotobacter chroococcum]|uniref:hypothetical protein n=1 Tax=Azotobacter chroococcum TaxID=353 RepID=UPI00118713C1|nr:hypothetical protein [Azotobacter chroococcum]
MNIIKPTYAQALELLGKWVICRVDWGGGEADDVYDTEPAQIVGVVVPAPGSAVAAQILMHGGRGLKASEGYEFELFLDVVKFLQVVDHEGGF